MQVPLAHAGQFRLKHASITLTPRQLDFAAKVANRIHAVTPGRTNGHGVRPGEITQQDEIIGHAGELAVALILGVEWIGDQGDSASPDVGSRTQVRTLTRASSCRLLVRPHDLDKYGDVPYVLVKPDPEGRTFTVLGWCMASEVPFMGKLCDGGHRSRPACWMVHPAVLHPIRSLKNP